jgi:hypothetical protein
LAGKPPESRAGALLDQPAQLEPEQRFERRAGRQVGARDEVVEMPHLVPERGE